VQLGEIRVGVRATTESFGTWLDSTLAPYLSSHASDPHYSVVLPEGAGSPGRRLSVLYKGTITIARTFSRRTIARVLLAELESVGLATRDDAIYLNGSIARGDGGVALIPAALVHHITRLRRQLERARLQISPLLSIAVDPSNGRVVPVAPRLATPPGALDRLEDAGALTNGSTELFVDEPLDVDVVCRLGDVVGPPTSPLSRGAALRELAGETLNLGTLGGAALEGLAKLVAGTRCVSLGGDDARVVIESLAASLGTSPGGGRA